MSEMHLKQPGFMLVDHFLTPKKEYKNLNKQEIRDIFIKMNQIKLAFSITWLMGILRISLEEQLLIKYYVLKHLVLLKIPNMMNISVDLFQWFINSLMKSLLMLIPHMMLLCTKQQLAEELHKPIIGKFEKR